MKTPLTPRIAAFALSALMTLLSVQVIAEYAYPGSAGAGGVQLASTR